MTTRLQQRRDTAANWTSNNPTLAAGEIGYETDTAKFKIGTGSTAWTSLAYAAGQAPALAMNLLSTSTASYTLIASDSGTLVQTQDASAVTITVPPSVFATGQVITVQQIAAGQVTFAAGSGVTITSTGATAAAPVLRTEYSSAAILCTGTNTFTVLGDII